MAKKKSEVKTKTKTLKAKNSTKELPVVSDHTVLLNAIQSYLDSLPLPSRYKVAFLFEKAIKGKREETKEALIEKLKKEGMETEKGYFMQDGNFIIKLTISHPQRLDVNKFKKAYPELYAQFLTSYEKKDLYVEEIKPKK